MGVQYARINFKTKTVEQSTFEEFNGDFKSKIATERKSNKQIRGEEDWRDYDITHFIVDAEDKVFFVLEKRLFYAEGYPHIKRDAFDKSHNVELLGHIHSEGIIMMAFDTQGKNLWQNYIAKNQIYPAGDGLNTISFTLDYSKSQFRLLYATSENADGALNNINLIAIDKNTGGKSSGKLLPNNDKITFVKDYTVWYDESIIIVGKKGLLGKASIIAKYKL